ncbi:MAG: chitobiase/beta-hexosaminidase C-terminal domain-containing protein [Lachnospiraceae bacterium]|nr:chitobiase/beta-hexosaminidase C-terminal domain-containing protein [Lachnospiraceae bacterium]
MKRFQYKSILALFLAAVTAFESPLSTLAAAAPENGEVVTDDLSVFESGEEVDAEGIRYSNTSALTGDEFLVYDMDTSGNVLKELDPGQAVTSLDLSKRFIVQAGIGGEKSILYDSMPYLGLLKADAPITKADMDWNGDGRFPDELIILNAAYHISDSRAAFGEPRYYFDRQGNYDSETDTIDQGVELKYSAGYYDFYVAPGQYRFVLWKDSDPNGADIPTIYYSDRIYTVTDSNNLAKNNRSLTINFYDVKNGSSYSVSDPSFTEEGRDGIVYLSASMDPLYLTIKGLGHKISAKDESVILQQVNKSMSHSVGTSIFPQAGDYEGSGGSMPGPKTTITYDSQNDINYLDNLSLYDENGKLRYGLEDGLCYRPSVINYSNEVRGIDTNVVQFLESAPAGQLTIYTKSLPIASYGAAYSADLKAFPVNGGHIEWEWDIGDKVNGLFLFMNGEGAGHITGTPRENDRGEKPVSVEFTVTATEKDDKGNTLGDPVSKVFTLAFDKNWHFFVKGLGQGEIASIYAGEKSEEKGEAVGNVRNGDNPFAAVHTLNALEGMTDPVIRLYRQWGNGASLELEIPYESGKTTYEMTAVNLFDAYSLEARNKEGETLSGVKAALSYDGELSAPLTDGSYIFYSQAIYDSSKFSAKLSTNDATLWKNYRIEDGPEEINVDREKKLIVLTLGDRRQDYTLKGSLTGYNEFRLTDEESLAKWREKAGTDETIAIDGSVARRALKVTNAVITVEQKAGDSVITASAASDPEGSFVLDGLLEGLEASWRISAEGYPVREGMLERETLTAVTELGTIELGQNRSGQTLTFLVAGLSGGAKPGSSLPSDSDMASLLKPTCSVNGVSYPLSFDGYKDEEGNPNYDPKTAETIYASFSVTVPADVLESVNHIEIDGLPGGKKTCTLPEVKTVTVVVTDEETEESEEKEDTAEVYEAKLSVSGYGLLDWGKVLSYGKINAFAFSENPGKDQAPLPFTALGAARGILPEGTYELILSSSPLAVYGDYDETKMLKLSQVSIEGGKSTVLSGDLVVPAGDLSGAYVMLNAPKAVAAGQSFEINGVLYPGGKVVKELELYAPGLSQVIIGGRTVRGSITGGNYGFIFRDLDLSESTPFTMTATMLDAFAGNTARYNFTGFGFDADEEINDQSVPESFPLGYAEVSCRESLTLSVPRRAVAGRDGTVDLNFSGIAKKNSTVGIYREELLLAKADSNGTYSGTLILPSTESVQVLTARYLSGESREEARTALQVIAGGPRLKYISMGPITSLTPGSGSHGYVVTSNTATQTYSATFELPSANDSLDKYLETVSYVCEGEETPRSGKVFFKIRTAGGSYIVPVVSENRYGTRVTVESGLVNQGSNLTLGITVLYELKNFDKGYSYVYRDSVFTDGDGNRNVDGRRIGETKAETLQAQIRELCDLETQYKEKSESSSATEAERSSLQEKIYEKQRALETDLNSLASESSDLLPGETEVAWAGNRDGSDSEYSDVGYSVKNPESISDVGEVPDVTVTSDSTLSADLGELIVPKEGLSALGASGDLEHEPLKANGLQIGDWNSLIKASDGEIQDLIDSLNAQIDSEYGEGKAAAWQVGNMGAAVSDDELMTATTFVDYAKAVNEEMMSIMGYQLSDYTYKDKNGKERTSRLYSATTYYAYSGHKIFSPEVQKNEIASILQTYILLNPEVTEKNKAYRWMRVQYAVAMPGAAIPIYTNGFVCPIASWMPTKYTSAEEVRKSWGTNGTINVSSSGSNGQLSALGGTDVKSLKYKKIQTERKRDENGFYDTNVGGLFGTGIRVNLDPKAFGWGTIVGLALLGCSVGLKGLSFFKNFNDSCLKGIDAKWKIATEVADDGYEGVGFARKVYGDLIVNYDKASAVIDLMSVTTNAASQSGVENPIDNMDTNLRDGLRFIGELQTKYRQWENIPEDDTNTMLAKYLNKPGIDPKECKEALDILVDCQQELHYLQQEIEGCAQQQDFTNWTTNLIGFAAVPVGTVSGGYGGMAYSAISSVISGANDTRLCDLGAKVERYGTIWERAKKAAAKIGFDLQTGKPLTEEPEKKDGEDDEETGNDGRSSDTQEGDDVTTNPRQDPSGFVYEAVLSNRIKGAKVSLYAGSENYKPAYSKELAEEPVQVPNNLPNSAEQRIPETGEIIPEVPVQMTDENGFYQWYVAEGLWYVTAEKDGYTQGDSEGDTAATADVSGRKWLPVLPAQLNVNIPLVDSTTVPVPDEVQFRTDGIYISFNKYMKEDSLGLTGAASDLSAFYEVTDENGNAVSFTAEALDSEAAPDNIVYAEGIPSYTSKLLLKFDAVRSEGAVLQVRLKSGAGRFTSYAGTAMEEDYFVNGEASIRTQVSAPVFSPVSRSILENTEVTVTCPTEGAKIFYTLDGSDPADTENPNRSIYYSPLTIAPGTRVRAVAWKLGYEASEASEGVYSLGNEINAADPEPAVKSVSLSMYGETLSDGDEIPLALYESKQLTAVALDTDAADRTVHFESSDPAVVRITSTGYMTALSEGEAVIYAKGIGIDPVSVTVRVSKAADTGVKDIRIGNGDGTVSRIELSRRNIRIKPGESVELYAIVTPEDTDRSISWYKTQGALSKVYVYGSAVRIVAGEAEETFTVRAVSGELNAACKVTVVSGLSEGETPEGGIWTAGLYTGTESGLRNSYTYTGSAITPGTGRGPALRVYYDGVLLTNGTDYTLSYKNNTNAQTADSTKAPSVTVKLKGSYKGTKSFPFTIEKKPLSASDVIKTPISVVTDNKKAVKLSPMVFYNGKLLKAGKDYTLPKDLSLTEAGKYSMLITGNGSFEGSASIDISIREKGELFDLSKAKVVLKDPSSIKAFDPGAPVPQTPEFELTDKGGKLLAEGTDYTAAYSGNVYPGTALIQFTATAEGRCFGSKKASFKIREEKQDLSDTSVISIAYDHYAPYLKSGAKPSLTVTDTRYTPAKVLTAGKDYTVSFGNNKEVTEAGGKKIPKLKISGKGAYQGTVEKSFVVTKQELSGLTITVEDVVFSNKEKAFQKTKMVVKDSEGKTVSNKEYKVEFEPESGIPAAGSVITAHFTAKTREEKASGGYTGTVTACYKVIDKANNISAAKVSFQKGGSTDYNGKAFVYKGKPVEPGALNLTVTLSKPDRILTWGTDYLITGFEKNEKTGTGKLYLKGIGDYGGRKVVSFPIVNP